MLLLYPNDNVSHRDILDYIVRTYDDFIYINHNKDFSSDSQSLKNTDKSLKTDTDLETLKEHTHLIIRFPNGRWNTAVANELSLELNLIQPVNNMNLALAYLIHYNDDSKYQYELSDLKGGRKLKEQLQKYINNHDKTETDKITEMIDFIVNMDSYLSITVFSMWVADIGYWDVYRRNAVIIHNIIKENNVYLERN